MGNLHILILSADTGIGGRGRRRDEGNVTVRALNFARKAALFTAFLSIVPDRVNVQ